jgi:hypothetical protein
MENLAIYPHPLSLCNEPDVWSTSIRNGRTYFFPSQVASHQTTWKPVFPSARLMVHCLTHGLAYIFLQVLKGRLID